jgi:DNA-binding NtrC family response regulator
MVKPLILVVEDNREIRVSARFVLEDFGFAIAEAENPAQAKLWLAQQKADLILLDMNFGLDTTSGEEGLAFLKWLQQQAWDIPVIAMTAWSNTALVVNAMQLGAGDFIEKPWNNQRLHQVLLQQLQLQQLNRKNRALSQRLEDSAPELVWQSHIMNQLMQQLAAVASTDANILLTGENGTGKSQLAHWLHLNSTRASQAFISVNMGAIPESLFESEMFGHKKGAFTDAKEQRIGRFEMLGSSQTQRTDVRIISASNGDFPQLISEGNFRQDLFYRLNTLEFRVPALRERPEDIAALAVFFVAKHGQRYRKPELNISASALKALVDYHWPGNIRELSHMMERAVLLTQSDELTAAQLNLPSLNLLSNNISENRMVLDHLPMMTLEAAELQLINQALAECDGNKQKAADLLGITKSSLYRRLEKYDLAY